MQLLCSGRLQRQPWILPHRQMQHQACTSQVTSMSSKAIANAIRLLRDDSADEKIFAPPESSIAGMTAAYMASRKDEYSHEIEAMNEVVGLFKAVGSQVRSSCTESWQRGTSERPAMIHPLLFWATRQLHGFALRCAWGVLKHASLSLAASALPSRSRSCFTHLGVRCRRSQMKQSGSQRKASSTRR